MTEPTAHLEKALAHGKGWFFALDARRASHVLAQEPSALAELGEAIVQDLKPLLAAPPFHRIALGMLVRDLVRAGLLDCLSGRTAAEHVVERLLDSPNLPSRFLMQLEGLRFTVPCEPIAVSPRCKLRSFSEEEWRGLNSPLVDERIRSEIISECVFLECRCSIEPERVTIVEGYGLPPSQNTPPVTAIEAALPELVTLVLSGVGAFRAGARLDVVDGWAIELHRGFDGSLLKDGSWVSAPREDVRIGAATAAALSKVCAATYGIYSEALKVVPRNRLVALRFLRATSRLSQLRPDFDERESCFFELVRSVDGALSAGKNSRVGDRWDRFFDVVGQIEGTPIKKELTDLFRQARNAIAHGDMLEELPCPYWMERCTRRFLRAYFHLTSQLRSREAVLNALKAPLQLVVLETTRNAGVSNE
jgi:hypothetical protein